MYRFLIILLTASPLFADGEPLKPKCTLCTVQKSTIILGDLFHMPAQFENYTVGESPLPGLKTIIPAGHLQKILAPLGFHVPNMPRITITREAKTLDPKKIEALLLSSLTEQDQLSSSAPEQTFGYDIILKTMHVKVPAHTLEEGEVEALTLDPRSRLFKASVRFKTSIEGDDFTAEIEGRAYPIMAFPVLRERLNAGTLIKADHLTTTNKRMNAVNRDMITNESDLIGKNTVRALLPGQPVYTKDLERPVLIKKDDLVTIIAEEPGIKVTLQGQALNPACKDEPVTVRNLSSKKDIGCIAIAQGTAKVMGDAL